MRGLWKTAGAFCLLARSAAAIELDLNDHNSIKSAASTIAYGLMKYYTGNNTGDVAGNLPDPYYWWEAGAMFGALVDYWWMTGDDTYNNLTVAAMVHQAGNDRDFMPTNVTLSEGNDDQGFWALAAMAATETNFTNPGSDDPQWLALVQAVFNEYVSRWDAADCGGGLRWQIFTFNAGYDYKNSISNGCFFNVASRLARYTDNATYADWAEKVWNWENEIGFITDDYNIYDGAGFGGDSGNCTNIDQVQWSYNAGIYLHGVAAMYNYTNGSSVWKTRLDGLLNHTTNMFFNNSIMYEQYCEPTAQCNLNEQSFKGYLLRWMAGTTQLASYTYDIVYPLIQKTAAAAAASCSGSPATGFKGMPGTACGFRWTSSSFDGLVGVGEQMNAMSAVMYTLIQDAAAPVTANNGGSSQGNPSAGATGSKTNDGTKFSPITMGQRVGAGFLTTVVLGSLIGGCAFVMI